MELTIVMGTGASGAHEPIKLKVPSDPIETPVLARMTRAVQAFEAEWLSEEHAMALTDGKKKRR